MLALTMLFKSPNPGESLAALPAGVWPRCGSRSEWTTCSPSWQRSVCIWDTWPASDLRARLWCASWCRMIGRRGLSHWGQWEGSFLQWTLRVCLDKLFLLVKSCRNLRTPPLQVHLQALLLQVVVRNDGRQGRRVFEHKELAPPSINVLLKGPTAPWTKVNKLYINLFPIIQSIEL